MKLASAATAVTAVVTALVCAPPPAAAQDFGRLLGRMAERAVEDAVRPRTDRSAATRPERTGPSSHRNADEDAAAAPSAVEPPPPGVEPWPTNAGHRAVVRPTQFAFRPEDEAQRQAYRDASRYACSGCEASMDIDSWRKALRPHDDTYSAWSAVIGAWTPGRVIDWRGGAHDGRITVVSEIPVGGFSCRQLRHRISTRGANPVVAEYPGLICLGRQDAYSGADTWHEVF